MPNIKDLINDDMVEEMELLSDELKIVDTLDSVANHSIYGALGFTDNDAAEALGRSIFGRAIGLAVRSNGY